jgi:hypothetical protein
LIVNGQHLAKAEGVGGGEGSKKAGKKNVLASAFARGFDGLVSVPDQMPPHS